MRQTLCSPTPWTADDTGSVIIASNGNVIAVQAGTPVLQPSAQDRANFKLIERCVNNHDALRLAVLYSADALEHGTPAQYDRAREACKKALTALYFPEAADAHP